MTFDLTVPAGDDPRWTRRDGILVRRNEGITKMGVADTTTVKITAAQTNGALGVLQSSVPPGMGPIAHAHGREDEAFYVLSGDFEFLNGDETFTTSPGDFVFIPRGNRHRFTNIGPLPASLLTFMLPGGHEQFWIDNGLDPEPTSVQPAVTPESLQALATQLARHRVTLLPETPLPGSTAPGYSNHQP